MTDPQKIKELEKSIIELKAKLAFEMRKNIGDKILLDHYTRLFSATTANYLLDPNPETIETQGTKTGSSNTHLVQIKKIIALNSEGRMKKIFLTDAQAPVEGGVKENPLVLNSKTSNWPKALFAVQRNNEFLFRVHKSFAINIFHYTLSKDGDFKLHEKLKKAAPEIIHSIPADGEFKAVAYQKRLL